LHLIGEILFSLAVLGYVGTAVCALGYVVQSATGGFTPRAGRLIAVWAFSAHTLALIALSAGSRNLPITNVFESIVLFLWCVALVSIFADCVYNLPTLNAFLMPLVVVLAVGAIGFVERGPALAPGLKKFWLAVHIAPIFLGYGAFAIAGALSLMYLTQQSQLKSKAFGPLLSRLPSLEILDRLSARTVAVGFPLLTIGLILGFVWVRTSGALGEDWMMDWKVAGGVITWLVYAVLLHVRVARARTGKLVAYLTLAGFLLVLFTFLGTFMLGEKHGFK